MEVMEEHAAEVVVVIAVEITEDDPGAMVEIVAELVVEVMVDAAEATHEMRSQKCILRNVMNAENDVACHFDQMVENPSFVAIVSLERGIRRIAMDMGSSTLIVQP